MDNNTEQRLYSVVYVEDKPELRVLIPRLLGKRFVVTTCEDYHNGLETIRNMESPVDLFMTDIELPDGEGYNLVPILRDKHPDIPVIVASGALEHLRDAKNLLGGLDRIVFMSKPLGLEEFRRKVTSLVP